jgi:two-component system, OmpR family, response regulator QseB
VSENELATVLLVEDDRDLSGMLGELLTDEGYQVDTALDGQRGLHLALTRRYEVMILDRRLPVLDGLDLLSRLRGRGVLTPVLVLSALGNPADRVRGLDAGAEDYLAKPFDVAELLARLRALRRRHHDMATTLPLGVRYLNLDSRCVQHSLDAPDQDSIPLSQRECALLAMLAARPCRVFSRSELRGAVFAGTHSDVLVDTYVHYLRRKLGRGIVTTVRGLGYRLGRG